MFRPGKKDSPEDYNGGRTASDIVTFAKNAAEANAKPRPVVQITMSDARSRSSSRRGVIQFAADDEWKFTWAGVCC